MSRNAACGLSFPHAPHLWFDGDHDHAPDRICPGTTASADVDYRAAWEAAAKVVVAVGRFVEAERDGTPALIEDAHFGLLKALTDYRAGAK